MREVNNKEYLEWLNSITEKDPKSGLIHYIYIPELNNFKAHTTSINKVLRNRLGMTKRQWINLHMFGDKDYEPICPYCGTRPLALNIWIYRTNCCSYDCKCAMRKEIWAREGYRELQLESHAKTYATQEYKDRQSSSCRKLAYRMIAEKRGMFSDEAKAKNLDKEHQKSRSQKVKNNWKSNDFRTKCINGLKEYWKNDDNAERYITSFKPWKGKFSHLYSKYENKEIKFDSSWERSYFIYMSEHNPEIVSIRRDIKCIKYFNSSKDQISRYRPDFIVEYKDGHKEIIEIKPKFRMTEVNVHEKREAAEKYCSENERITYVILTEDELKSMGVLDEYSAPIYK